MIEKLSVRLVKYRLPLLLAVSIAALAFPMVFTSKYLIRIVILCLMYCMLSVSLNLMTGVLGQMSFGHAAFWGIGAYTAAILARIWAGPGRRSCWPPRGGGAVRPPSEPAR